MDDGQQGPAQPNGTESNQNSARFDNNHRTLNNAYDYYHDAPRQHENPMYDYYDYDRPNYDGSTSPTPDADDGQRDRSESTHVRWSSGEKGPGDDSDEADDESAKRRRARGNNRSSVDQSSWGHRGTETSRRNSTEQPFRKPFPSEIPRDFDHIYPPPPAGYFHPSSPSNASDTTTVPPPLGPQKARTFPETSRASAAYTPRSATSAPYVPSATYVPPAPYPPSAPSSRGPSPAPEHREPTKERKSAMRPQSSSLGSQIRSSLEKMKSDGNPRQAKNLHVAASVAGAVAGGLIGHQASKGDVVATVAGAMLGLLGAGVAEEEVAKKKARERVKGKRGQGT